MKLVSIHKQVIFLLALLFAGQSSSAQSWDLQQCIDAAQSLNKNLQIAENNIILSNKKGKEAKAHLLPKLMANADYKYFTNLPYQLLPLSTFNPSAPEGQFQEAQFGVPHNISANLQLAVPIYNPHIYGGIKASKIASEVSKLEYEKSKEQINFEIANLYYNAQILHAHIAFLDSNVVNARRLLRNLTLLHDQLLAKRTDVEKIQLQLAQLVTQKSTIESKRIQVINALKFVIGIPSEQVFSIEQKVSHSEENQYSHDTSIASKLIQSQRKLLQNDINTLNHTRYLPNINIIGSFGTSGFGYDKEPNAFLKFYTLGFAGIQISYPVFNGTLTVRRISQKKVELRNNGLRAALIQDQDLMKIANAKLQRGTTYLAIETSTRHILLAQSIYNNTVLQQKQGVATLTEVLSADNALREAQQANLSAIIDYLKADLELKNLTGNL